MGRSSSNVISNSSYLKYGKDSGMILKHWYLAMGAVRWGWIWETPLSLQYGVAETGLLLTRTPSPSVLVGRPWQGFAECACLVPRVGSGDRSGIIYSQLISGSLSMPELELRHSSQPTIPMSHCLRDAPIHFELRVKRFSVNKRFRHLLGYNTQGAFKMW